MRRRALLVGGLALPLLAAGGRELLRARRAEFFEAGAVVQMSVALPELLSPRDDDAMASLASAFATTLDFEITLYRAGVARPLARRRRVVKIQWDPWRERFVVSAQDDGGAAQSRSFAAREAAIAAAVSLERVTIAEASLLERGPQATYFVTVIGQRNPISPELLPELEAAAAREQGRDLAVFSRWIGVFVSDVPAAEKTAAIRTSPGFYLVRR